MERKFKTSIVSLDSLQNLNFSIPTYQRPYVWGEEQLKKLLDDFYQAFISDSNSVYYVSTFITREEGSTADLIDGQQRFTTLWLISFVLSRICPKSEISKFLKQKDRLRLNFEIRNEVSEFLSSLLEDEGKAKKILSEEQIEEKPYLKNIAKALVFINGYFKQLDQSQLEPIGNYIYHRVRMVKNSTPPNTDLNKLFSVINSAGVQLEQTDIVKANLLNRIDNKVMFGKIWEACENMNNYFERNARVSFPTANWKSINLCFFTQFKKDLFFKEEVKDFSQGLQNFSIDNMGIMEAKPYVFQEMKSEENNRNSEDVYCRSIINFGQLLLHTYRIFLYKKGNEDFKGTFHVSRLIEIFKGLEQKSPEEIKDFFLLLWEVRYLFDKYVIKWYSDANTKNESLEIVNFNKNQDHYYSRTIYTKSNSMMLQSVLYYTGDYLRQYWLTAYLGYLLDQHNNLAPTDQVHLNYLEKMDNIFSLNDSTKDKELSWQLLIGKNTEELVFDERYLRSAKGTGFKHYWFQKLEYILWKNWEYPKTEEFLNYRITSKNSVEHIYPQNPENRIQHPEIEEKDLHSFGNLVLLNVSQNSEYSNKSVGVKRSMFREKRDHYDTLKSFYIFSQKNWTTEEIELHLEKMIEKLVNHFKS